MLLAYCLKCRTKTETLNYTIIFNEERKTFRVKGTCAECGTNKSTFIDKNQGKEIK